MTRRLLPILFVSLSLLFVACGDDDDAPAAKPTCEQIYEACHEVDPGSGPIHECHENAEAAATTEAQCIADSTNCLAICAAAATDAGSDDAGSDDAAAP